MKAIKSKMTQSQIVKEIAQNTGVSRLDVKSVLEEQASVVEACLMPKGIGKIILPFLGIKCSIKIRPARKAGMGMSFGKEIMLKARPKMRLVKATALKRLKDMAL